MSEHSDEKSTETTTGISDDQLPEDLVPGEDNPLAEGLEDGETAGDLYEDGKQAERSQDEDDAEDASRD
jgi:hypothetical protein